MTALEDYKYGLHQELDNGVDEEAAYWPEKDTVTMDTINDLGDARGNEIAAVPCPRSLISFFSPLTFDVNLVSTEPDVKANEIHPSLFSLFTFVSFSKQSSDKQLQCT